MNLQESIVIGVSTENNTIGPRGIALGYGSIMSGRGDVAFGTRTDMFDAKIGCSAPIYTGMKKIHIGHNLVHKECDLNICDLITGDNTTGAVTIHGPLDVLGVSVSQVTCDICITDSDMSLRCRVERARKKATLGSISDEEVVLINEYKPATKPGFCWDHEGYMRSMCVNCIFEASFDFAAKLRLGLYNEDNAADAEDNAVDAEDITVDGAPGDRSHDNDIHGDTTPVTSKSSDSITKVSPEYIHMQNQIDQLLESVNILTNAVKKLTGAN
jgi:hypothetical protein